MHPQSSVSLSQTLVDSLASLLSRLEDGNVKDIFVSRETDVVTGAFYWEICVSFSDLESVKVVLTKPESDSWKQL